MSRIGKLPIKVPAGVDVTCDGLNVTVKGKFGTLQTTIPDSLGVEHNDGTLIVNLKNESRSVRALHGLYRTLINNMVIGVSEQFQVTLNLQGVGYRAAVQGKTVVLNLGFSHPVEIEVPSGISVKMDGNTKFTIYSADKQKLGEFAAMLRSKRPPEPFKGKELDMLTNLFYVKKARKNRGNYE